jgi:O-succinylbenzoate synthase
MGKPFGVSLLLQFRRYALPFRGPVRTAHGLWSVREGVIVRLESPDGRIGWGEAAPVPGFSPESAAQDEALLASLGRTIGADAWEGVRPLPACLRHALAAAAAELVATTGPSQTPHLPVAALLPAGRAALGVIAAKAEAGFRTFKWKVGVAAADEELGLFDDLCGRLPEGARLRLDANGAWDRRTAERWLDRCADRPVEFVEQPAFAPGPTDGEATRRKADDLLLGLAHDFPTPIALDESLAGDGDVERWLGAGWPGVFVLKPALHGDLTEALSHLARSGAAVVFSSALETAIGAREALRVAFAWEDDRSAGPRKSGKPRALGFGVTPLFADSRFDGPATAPFLYREDVERLNPEAEWNALS